jgi:hypothetical protein
MDLLFEHEILRDLASKVQSLDELHRRLVRKIGSEPLAAADLLEALELARATVRDCAVSQENHAGGLIPLQKETLGETFVALRAAETIIKDVIASLVPIASDPAAPPA